jgi:hypothetical protein
LTNLFASEALRKKSQGSSCFTGLCRSTPGRKLELNAFVAKVLGNGFSELLEKRWRERESERGRWEVSVVIEAQKELQFESVSLC